MRAHSTHGLWFPTGRNPAGDRRWRQGTRPEASLSVEANRKGTFEWLCQISACASYWKLVFTSATRPTAGTRRWRPTSTAPATTSTSSTSAQTVPLLHQALKQVSDTVAKGGRVLFVGTKRQASDIVADAAQRSAQYYVNSRWLGGMLTNWKTISNSISRLRKLDEMLAGEAARASPRRSASTSSASARSSTRRLAASRTWARRRT